jgi:RsiW-degrading membrane proteinase PrsW (M82 family)
MKDSSMLLALKISNIIINASSFLWVIILVVSTIGYLVYFQEKWENISVHLFILMFLVGLLSSAIWFWRDSLVNGKLDILEQRVIKLTELLMEEEE